MTLPARNCFSLPSNDRKLAVYHRLNMYVEILIMARLAIRNGYTKKLPRDQDGYNRPETTDKTLAKAHLLVRGPKLYFYFLAFHV